jgi:hypothetical protein
MFLARMITRPKWQPKQGLASDEIPADAITADLRTSNNVLSFWQCGEATDPEISTAVLAIAAGRDRLWSRPSRTAAFPRKIWPRRFGRKYGLPCSSSRARTRLYFRCENRLPGLSICGSGP